MAVAELSDEEVADDTADEADEEAFLDDEPHPVIQSAAIIQIDKTVHNTFFFIAVLL